jgi:hypothetical protein
MKQVSREDLLNGWLKYHNTTVEEVIKTHPKEVLENPDWFKLYPCTQQQHDEWATWAKAYIKKVTHYSKSIIERGWGVVYLDCAPYVTKE